MRAKEYQARVREIVAEKWAAMAPSMCEVCGCAPGVRCFVELEAGWGVCAFDRRVGRRCSVCTGDATRSRATLDELLARDA